MLEGLEELEEQRWEEQRWEEQQQEERQWLVVRQADRLEEELEELELVRALEH